MHTHDAGSYDTQRITNPYHEADLLRETFPDVGECAGEDMRGELPVGEMLRNYRGGVGPSLTQLLMD
jgi:hypothetical protein